MYLSTSAFGVVVSSNPQIVVIDHGRTSTVEVKDNDNRFSCNQFLQTYTDKPLDLLFRKQNESEVIKQNGLSTDKAPLAECESDLNNLVSEAKNNNGDRPTESEIQITNVRSLATNHLAEEMESLQENDVLETIFETSCGDTKRHERLISKSDDQLDLNNGRRKRRKCPNNRAIIRCSPSSIRGLRKIRPRPSYLDQTPGNSKELSRKNRIPSTFALNKSHPINVKQFGSSKQMSENDAASRELNIQTNPMDCCTKQRNPMFILPSSQMMFNPVISESQNTSGLEGTNQPQLQISPALKSGLHTHTLRQKCPLNSSSPNDSDTTSPSATLSANFIPNPLIQNQNRTISTCLRTTTKKSTGKNERSKPLSDELLDDLEVVRIHRRPQFHCEESRELVEVRPRCLSDVAPTLLAYRELSGHILVDWKAKSNYPAAEKIKKMMQSILKRKSHLDRESNLAQEATSTNTAQCPYDVTTLLVGGAVYTISDQ